MGQNFYFINGVSFFDFYKYFKSDNYFENIIAQNNFFLSGFFDESLDYIKSSKYFEDFNMFFYELKSFTKLEDNKLEINNIYFEKENLQEIYNFKDIERYDTLKLKNELNNDIFFYLKNYYYGLIKYKTENETYFSKQKFMKKQAFKNFVLLSDCSFNLHNNMINEGYNESVINEIEKAYINSSLVIEKNFDETLKNKENHKFEYNLRKFFNEDIFRYDFFNTSIERVNSSLYVEKNNKFLNNADYLVLNTEKNDYLKELIENKSVFYEIKREINNEQINLSKYNNVLIDLMKLNNTSIGLPEFNNELIGLSEFNNNGGYNLLELKLNDSYYKRLFNVNKNQRINNFLSFDAINKNVTEIDYFKLKEEIENKSTENYEKLELLKKEINNKIDNYCYVFNSSRASGEITKELKSMLKTEN